MSQGSRQGNGSPTPSSNSGSRRFSINPLRARSTRWQKAPAYDYGGDEWGEDGGYDDDQLDHAPGVNTDMRRNSGQFGYSGGPYDAAPAMPTIPAQFQHPNRTSTLPAGYDPHADPRQGIARQGTAPNVGSHNSRFGAPGIQRKPSKMEREARANAAMQAEQMAAPSRPAPQTNESVYYTPAQDQAEYGWTGAGNQNLGTSTQQTYDNRSSMYSSDANYVRSPDSPSAMSDFIGQTTATQPVASSALAKPPMTPTDGQTSSFQASSSQIRRPRDIYAQAQAQVQASPPRAGYTAPADRDSMVSNHFPTVIEPDMQRPAILPRDSEMHVPGGYQQSPMPTPTHEKLEYVPANGRGLVPDVPSPGLSSSYTNSEHDLANTKPAGLSTYGNDAARKSNLFLDVDTEDDISRKNKVSPPPPVHNTPPPPVPQVVKQGFLQVPMEAPPAHHHYQYDSDDEDVGGYFHTGTPPNGSRSPSPTSSIGSTRVRELGLSLASPTSPGRSPTLGEREQQSMHSLSGPPMRKLDTHAALSNGHLQQPGTEISPTSAYTTSQPPSSRASPVKVDEAPKPFADIITNVSNGFSSFFSRAGDTPTDQTSPMKESTRAGVAASPIQPTQGNSPGGLRSAGASSQNTMQRGLPPQMFVDRRDNVSPPTPVDSPALRRESPVMHRDSPDVRQESPTMHHAVVSNVRNSGQWRAPSPDRSGGLTAITTPLPGQTEIAKSAEWAVATPIMISSARQSPTSATTDDPLVSQPLLNKNSQPAMYTPQSSNPLFVPSTVPGMQEQAESLRSVSSISSMSNTSRSPQLAVNNMASPMSAGGAKPTSFASFLHAKAPSPAGQAAMAQAMPTNSARTPSFAGFLGSKNQVPGEKSVNPASSVPASFSNFLGSRTSPAPPTSQPQAPPQISSQPVQPAQPSFRNFLGQKTSTAQLREDNQVVTTFGDPALQSNTSHRNSILPPRALMHQNNDSESNVSSVGSEGPPRGFAQPTAIAVQTSSSGPNENENLRREILRDLDVDSQASPDTPKDHASLKQILATEPVGYGNGQPGIPKRMGVPPLAITPPMKSGFIPAIPEQSPMRRSADGKKHSLDQGRMDSATLPTSGMTSLDTPQTANQERNSRFAVPAQQQLPPPGSNFPPPPSSEVSAVSRAGREDDEVSLATPVNERFERSVHAERPASPSTDRYTPSPVDNAPPQIIKPTLQQFKSYDSVPTLMHLKDILALSDADERIVAADKARRMIAADRQGGQTLQVWMQHVRGLNDPHKDVLSSVIPRRKMAKSEKYAEWYSLADDLDGSRPSTADSQERALTGAVRQAQIVTPQPTRLPNDPRMNNVLQAGEAREIQQPLAGGQQYPNNQFGREQQPQQYQPQDQTRPLDAQQQGEHVTKQQVSTSKVKDVTAGIKDSLGGVGKGFKGLFGGRGRKNKDEEEMRDEQKPPQNQPGLSGGYVGQQVGGSPQTQSNVPSTSFSPQAPQPQAVHRASFQNLSSPPHAQGQAAPPLQDPNQGTQLRRTPSGRPISATGRRPSLDGAPGNFVPPLPSGMTARRPPSMTMGMPTSPGGALEQGRSVSMQAPSGNLAQTGNHEPRRAFSGEQPERSSGMVSSPPSQSQPSMFAQPPAAQNGVGGFVPPKPPSMATAQGPLPLKPFDPDGPPPLRRVSTSQPLPAKRAMGMRQPGLAGQRPGGPPVAYSQAGMQQPNQQGRASVDGGPPSRTSMQNRPGSASYIQPPPPGQFHMNDQILNTPVQQGYQGAPAQSQFGPQGQHLQPQAQPSREYENSVSEASVNSGTKKKRFSTNFLGSFGHSNAASSVNSTEHRNSTSTTQSTIGDQPKGNFLSKQLKKFDAIVVGKEGKQHEGQNQDGPLQPPQAPFSQGQRVDSAGTGQYSGTPPNQLQRVDTGQSQYGQQPPSRIGTSNSTGTQDKKKSVFGRLKDMGTIDPLGKTEKQRNASGKAPMVQQEAAVPYGQPQLAPEPQKVFDVATGTFINQEEMAFRNQQAASGHLPGLGHSPLLTGYEDPTTPKAGNQPIQSYFTTAPGASAPQPPMIQGPQYTQQPTQQQYGQSNTGVYGGPQPSQQSSGTPSVVHSVSDTIRQSLDQGRPSAQPSVRKAVAPRQANMVEDVPPPPLPKDGPLPQMSVQPAAMQGQGLIRKVSNPPPPAQRFLVTPANPPPRRQRVGSPAQQQSMPQSQQSLGYAQTFGNYGQRAPSSDVSVASASPAPQEGRGYQASVIASAPINQRQHRSSSPPPLMFMAGGNDMSNAPPREQQTDNYARTSPVVARAQHTQSPNVMISPPTEPGSGANSSVVITPEPVMQVATQQMAMHHEPVMHMQNREMEPTHSGVGRTMQPDMAVPGPSQASTRNGEVFVSAPASRSESPVVSRNEPTQHALKHETDNSDLRRTAVDEEEEEPIVLSATGGGKAKAKEAEKEQMDTDEEDMFDDKIAVMPEGPVAPEKEKEEMPVMSATSGPGLGWEPEFYFD